MPESSDPHPGPEGAAEGAGDQQSVLSHISELIGSEPKVLLREDDGDEGVLSLGTEEARERPFLSRRYQILGEVARGGVGVVLKGHDLDLGRNVAVKVLRKDHLDNPVMVERFVEEAQIGGQLQHPGIVPVYELGQQEDRRPYFAMKLVKGRTLGRLLGERKDRREDRSRFLVIFHQVCQTVAYAHSRGVIHRDLKPANVMVGAFGEVQVVDWGLAKVMKEGGTADERRERSLQQSQMSVIETIRNRPGSSGSDSIAGSVMGTPAYMPPEQANGHVEKLDERSDVFALGAILCEVLTGEGPYVGTPEEVYLQAAHARLDDAFARLDSVQVDDDLIQLCKDCLAPAPPARPRDAGEVAQRLGAHLARVEERAHAAELAAVESRVRAANERKARRLTLALAATVVIAGALGATSYVVFQQQEYQRVRDAENAVSSACEDVRQLLGEAQSADVGDFSLLEAAALQIQSAEQLAADPDVSPESRERVQDLVATLAAQRSRAEAVVAEEARNQAMLQRLEVLRDESHDFGWDESAQGDRGPDSFAAAFRDFGMDVLQADLDEACAWIGEQTIALELAFALDDWARFQRAEETDAVRPWQELVIIAQAADPDDLRNEIRDAILDEDVEALRTLARSPDLVEVPAPTLVFLAESLWEEGLQPEAVALLRQAHSLYPGDFSVNSALAWRLEDSDGVAAGRHYAAAFAARPESPVARSNLAYALQIARELDEARELLEEGLRQHPGHRVLLQALSGVEYSAGNWERALALVREPSRDGPMSQEFLATQGMIHYFHGRVEDAVQAFEQAIAGQGDAGGGRNLNVERRLAMALHRAGRPEEAKELLSRAPDAWHTWVESLLEFANGNRQESATLWGFVRSHWRRQCESPTAGAGSHRCLAWVLTMHPDPEQRDPELALVHAERAVELLPKHPHCWLVLAAARYRTGDWLGVLDACEEARRPGLEPAWDHLDYFAAGAAWQLGDKDAARGWYQQGLTEAAMVGNALFWPTQESLRQEVAALLELE